ncbi:hypothetical protein GCM10007036_34350 [Alsobacter metallidurans]|uniref:Flagellar protein FlgJ N-terminal domain-containing protein n=1 Tax=Alsobacter metallidurans TaxID=340221 RepID=A0A917IA13_9HYPH|nr:rod-binding protein [Alsobacter metallidurans]GGH26505.1 hypothetical protein GCM10007036_34350 [Alsobacter metallidurans]
MGMTALAPAAIGASAYAAVAGKVADKDRDPKMNKTAQDFEAMFLENAFGQMFSGLQGEGPLGGQGAGAEIYRGMLTQEYAKTVSKRGGVGIADSVYRELIRMQERGGAAGGAARHALAANKAAAAAATASAAAAANQDGARHGF